MPVKAYSHKNIIKLLCAIPIAIIMNMDCFLSQPGSVDIGLSQYFMSFFVGQVTHGDTKTIVYAMGNLAFMIIFMILFGNNIAGKLDFVPAYYFVRIRDRGRWFVSEALKLICRAFVYSLLYCMMILIIAVILTGKREDSTLLAVFLYFLFISAAIMAVMCLLVNILTIIAGTSFAFISVCILMLVLCLCAISFGSDIASFFNPFSYIRNGNSGVIPAFSAVIYDGFIMLLVIFFGYNIMRHRDIAT